ncbi:MAG: tetratricopeptide repeat protein [Spirochaetales bacterium]|jgi:outer membrane protein assembly factor BamD (BamD/ComL family)|nr:tetratricopeptide repeat protein [Spirochaetales bacterium]
MNKVVKIAIFCVLCLTAGVFAQESPRSKLHRGIELYKKSDFGNAANAFRVLTEEEASTEKGNAYFWLAKSLSALERYEDASNYLEHFVANFSRSPYFSEAFYERGRILYGQKDYDSAIAAFQTFITRYPESEYVPNAYFWMGESLFAVGNLLPAEKMFSTVITQYPTSSRVETARYRNSLIGLKYREEELLKLLKWSHEEYLKSVDARANLEKTYTEIVSSYQRQIAALNTDDVHGQVLKLSEENRVLRAELEAQKAIRSAGTPAALTDPEFEGRMQILSAREQALKLKEEYLDQLISKYEGKN